MRRLLTLLLLLCALPAAAEAPKILVLGDSLSAGYGIDVDRSWPQLLQARLIEEGYEHQVVNASISGETTAGGASRIDAALAEFRPALVVVELGGNDGLRGLPPARMQQNLEKIVDTSRSAGAAVVLLGIRIPTNYGPRYRKAFEAVFRELAASHGVAWIEFFLTGIVDKPELMQRDGIHPNADAQPLLLDNAWPAIRAALDG